MTGLHVIGTIILKIWRNNFLYYDTSFIYNIKYNKI